MKCPTCGHRKHKCWVCVQRGEEDTVELPEARTAPQPPPLSLKPNSSKAIVSVVVGNEAIDNYTAGLCGLRRYAWKLGADMVTLTDYKGAPNWPTSAKFGIGRVLEFYDKILYVDCDTLIRPDTPDIFDMAGDADFAACCQKAYMHKEQLIYYRAFRAFLGATKEPSYYFNAGVYVASKAAQHVLGVPPVPIPVTHCAEEQWINVQAEQLNTRAIDRKANWQNWTDANFATAPEDAVLHWSGGGIARTSRSADIARLAKEYYG